VHHYSQSEKRSHLQQYTVALQDLLTCPWLSKYYPDSAMDYAENLQTALDLLENGFTQQQLFDLYLSFSPAIETHPHWIPPLVQTIEGGWRTPEWFDELQPKHQRVRDAANMLRYTGLLYGGRY
jgi:hypothetical protein